MFEASGTHRDTRLFRKLYCEIDIIGGDRRIIDNPEVTK